jgi:bis(5'-nucleosidyl)-tetraphosphatase
MNMIAFEKSAGAVIFRKEEGKIFFLLLHYISGHWDYVKGKIEKGEEEESTIKREAREEAGIEDLQIFPGFKKEIRFFYRAKGSEKEKRKKAGRSFNVMKKVVFYLAETKTKEIKISAEHIGYEWLEYDQALERITYPKSKELFKKANQFLLKL